MKVLYRRPQWLRIIFRKNVIAPFTNYYRKRKLHVIQKKKTKKQKNKRFSPFAKQLMIASACCLSKLLSTNLLRKLDSAKRDGRMMSWSGAILTESKVSEFCVCLRHIFQRVALRTENEIPLFKNWFPSVTWDVICIKKFSISFNSQYEINTDFADEDCGLSAHRS